MGYGNSYMPVGGQTGSTPTSSPLDAFSMYMAPQNMAQIQNGQGPSNGNNGFQPTNIAPLDMTSSGGNASPQAGYSSQWGMGPGGASFNSPAPVFNFDPNVGSGYSAQNTSTPWEQVFNGFQNDFYNLNAWNNSYGTTNQNVFNQYGTGWLSGNGNGDPSGQNTYNANFNYNTLSGIMQNQYQNAYNNYAATGAFGVPGGK
jgi:hypothetical protein